MTRTTLVFALSLALVGLAAWMLLKPTTAHAKALLKVGSAAPNFTLPSTAGTITLSNLLKAKGGQYGILVFYPMDNTPGCTVQLCSLRDAAADLAQQHTFVIGLNPANVASHAQFAKKQKYGFPLATDTDRSVAKAYGVGSMLGANSRTVVVVSPQGKVVFAEEGMPSPLELLQAVENHRLKR